MLSHRGGRRLRTFRLRPSNALAAAEPEPEPEYEAKPCGGEAEAPAVDAEAFFEPQARAPPQTKVEAMRQSFTLDNLRFAGLHRPHAHIAKNTEDMSWRAGANRGVTWAQHEQRLKALRIFIKRIGKEEFMDRVRSGAIRMDETLWSALNDPAITEGEAGPSHMSKANALQRKLEAVAASETVGSMAELFAIGEAANALGTMLRPTAPQLRAMADALVSGNPALMALADRARKALHTPLPPPTVRPAAAAGPSP